MKKAVAMSLTITGIAILPCYGMEITSIYPEMAYPGAPVTIIGGPFDSQVTVNLAGQKLQARRVSSRQLLSDGTVIPYEWDDSQAMSFVPPVLKTGSYGVQIVNSDGKSSLPNTPRINDRPEIDNVSQGDDFVNHYQEIISGTNFTSRSALLIREYPGGLSDMPPRQRFLNSRNGSARQDNYIRNSNAGNLIYQDCNTLIYNRYPPFRQDMRIKFQVSNPDGSQSSTYEAYLP